MDKIAQENQHTNQDQISPFLEPDNKIFWQDF